MKKSHRFLAPGVLVVLGLFLGVETRARAEPQKKSNVSPSKELLDDLLISYRTYDLPFPPADSPLVRFPVGSRSILHDGTEHENHGLGFLLKEKKDGERLRVYHGADEVRDLWYREKVEPVDPKPEALTDIGIVSIELAVQCHARGWTDLALKILGHNPRDERSPETQLAQAAWYHWQFKTLEADSDFAKIARRLSVIRNHRPGEFGEVEGRFLRSLELALAPGKGKRGSVEALIDDLIDVTLTDQSDLAPIKEPHANYLKVARLGFEAVPSLIEHLRDERLTRTRKQGFNNFRGYHYRVGDVVCDLLQGLASDDLGKDWLRRQQGYRLDKDDVEKWFAEARKVGEEDYFVKHVMQTADESYLNTRLILDVLAHKYPKQLPALYRKMLDERPRMYGWDFADAVGNSSLPKSTKQELFEHAAKNKVVSFRLDAISQLRKLEPPRALELLLAELEKVPGMPDGPYTKCPELRLADFVREWNEPSAWTSLEKTAKRVDVGFRLEFLQRVGWRNSPDATRKAALTLLSKFLDDPDLRVPIGPNYDLTYAGVHRFGRIEVRNFAAQEAAWLLKMDVDPKAKWTDEEWAKLREDVRRTLDRQGIK